MCYGTELTSSAILSWSKERNVECHYIAPDKPGRSRSCSHCLMRD